MEEQTSANCTNPSIRGGENGHVMCVAVFSGIIGALVISLIYIFINCCFKPLGMVPIRIENVTCVDSIVNLTDHNDSSVVHIFCHNEAILGERVDSVVISDIVKNANDRLMSDLDHLKKKGLVLTPQEYTNHLGDYYNSLIAVLIGLFVLFTLCNAVVLERNSRHEMEKLKNEILMEREKFKSYTEGTLGSLELEVDKIRNSVLSDKADNIEQIKKEILEHYADSSVFNESIRSYIFGKVEADVIEPIYLKIEEKTQTIQKDLDLLCEEIINIQDEISSMQDIETHE